MIFMSSPPSSNTIKRLSHARIECIVTIPPHDVVDAEKTVLQKAAQTIAIDGFRPGNAPQEKLREKIGADTLQQEIIRSLIPQIVSSLLREHHLTPIIPPTMAIVTTEPLVLSLTFVEKPRVTVKHIKTIEKKEQTVEDQEVEKLIESIMQQQKSEDSKPTLLTDEIAKALGSPSVESLRADVKKSLLTQKQRQEKQRQEHLLLSHIVDATHIDIAPELINEEVRSLYGELMDRLKSANMTIAEWLKRTQKNEGELQKEFESQATHRIKLRFGIEQLITEKSITTSDERISAEIQQYLEYLPPEERENARRKLAPGEDGYERLRWQLTVNALLANLLS